MMKQKTFEKSSDKIWKLKIKVLIFALTFAKRQRKKFFENITYQQVVQETYINTKHTVSDYDKDEILSEDINNFNNEEFDPGSG